jgi:hypothetical protein
MFKEGEAEHFQAGAVAITCQRIFDGLDGLLKNNFLVFYFAFLFKSKKSISM